VPEVRIAAEPRTEFGKGAARRTRRLGRVPAIIYGHGTDTRHITLPGHDLMMALKTPNVLIRVDGLPGGNQLALPKAVQRDPIRGSVQHVDLIMVRRGEKVTVEVPVQVTGEVFSGGLLDQQLVQVAVEAEATNIPHAFEVDIEGMEIGAAVHAGDLTLPAGATVASAQGACSTLPCSLGALDQGAVKLIVATVHVPASPPDPFPVTATVTPSTADAADNLTAATTTPVASGGDLQVTVAAPAQISAGAGATFTVTLTNAGPGTATGVVLSRSASAGGSALQVTGGGGACSVNGCSLATLGPGASQTFASQVTVPAGFSGSVTLTATVTSDTPDPNSANNTASATASTAAASSGKSGCSATGEPFTALGLLAVALALLGRRRAAAVSSR